VKIWNKITLVAVVIIAVVFSFMGGVFLGYANRPSAQKILNVIGKEPLSQMNTSQADFTPYWDVWSLVKEKYVDRDKIEDNKLVWGSIEGMVKSLGDPYSVFFPPQEAKEFQETVTGNFQGVGMEINTKDNVLTVVAPIKNSPAYRAGIRPGDKIIKIDDTPSADFSSEKAARLIKGEQGTKVRLTIFREGIEQPFELSIIRDVIEVPTIETEKKNDGIFIIRLYNFSANAGNAFRGALREFVESGSNKLILDLRGNPGGYLENAVDVSSWFLPLGEIVAKEKFADGQEELYKSRGYNVFKNLPIIILIDGGSASASEILAGALREHGKATLVGEKTFGKGSVQELVPMNNGTSLKITIAKWLTPKGVSLSQTGLKPDYEVKPAKDSGKVGQYGDRINDPQMDKAVELLKSM